jgi:AbiV family abortive infection protein
MPKKKVLSKHERDAQLRELSQGASKAFQNAEELFQEASLLHSHGALSRALFLHQISLEECGKIEMLGAWAASLLMGFEVDLRKVSVALASHKAKNYTNAYMLPTTKEELKARENANWQGAIDAFRRYQATFHLDSNSAKNASLYVDHENGQFSAPRDKITETMVADIARLNSEFLALAHPKVDMLLHWQRDTDEVQQTMTWFAKRAEELRAQLPQDLERAIAILMREMFERNRGSK